LVAILEALEKLFATKSDYNAMIDPPQFRASKSRLTRQQEDNNQILHQITTYIKNMDAESDAETIWMGMKPAGLDISISSFNNKLKTLVAAGLVKKRSTGYNKYLYQSA
jgi:Fe2+ or Zn2+ uptake regulation protein